MSLNKVRRDIYMLPVYLNIGNEAKSIINRNIWHMFDLLVSTCEGLSYEEILADIFPRYILDTNMDRCISVVKELYNMTQDGYERDSLTAFYECTLYRTILWWIDVAENIELEEIPRSICINKDGMDVYDYLNSIDNYLDFLFEDWDFLSVEEIYAMYKKKPMVLEKFLNINIERYIELMPKDIQEEHKEQREMEMRAIMDRKGMIVNISGGQVNIAKDSATINAIQNNGGCVSELDIIVKGIMDNLSELKKEDAEEIVDVLDMVKEELAKSEPKKNRLRNCLTLIAPMMTIANGIPTLATNLQELQDFIIQCLSRL